MNRALLAAVLLAGLLVCGLVVLVIAIPAGMVASKFSEMGTGGWAWILSDLKSLLETGRSM